MFDQRSNDWLVVFGNTDRNIGIFFDTKENRDPASLGIKFELSNFWEYDTPVVPLAVLRPSGPVIDPIIDLMARLAAESEVDEGPKEPAETPIVLEKTSEKDQVNYWLSPVIANDEQTAEEVIQNLVGVQGIYAYGERTPGRKHLKPGDMICFYAAGNGVVGHATVSSYPEKKPNTAIRDPERYPWLFSLEKNRTYIDNSVIIDAALRAKLDAFKNRDPNKPWAWFVFATRKISENDFGILIRKDS